MQVLEQEIKKRTSPTYLSDESKAKIDEFAQEYTKLSGVNKMSRESAINTFIKFAGKSAIENAKKAFQSIPNS
jgi:hypothetical protein